MHRGAHGAMTVQITFVRDMTFEYGRADQVSPLVRRVVANNPGPFTFHGTGTYIVGRGRVAVIDPGPVRADHLAAILRAVTGEQISHILITHTHLDHSPLAAELTRATGAVVHGFGPHGVGRAKAGGGPGPAEEGADRDFTPDQRLADGDVVEGDGWTLEAVHTPGHTSNHLCFALPEERALFTGDHVMGWSTSVVSPPDGDMAAYLASLQKLLERDDAIYFPTHGPPITGPRVHVEAFIAHRRERAAQILECLESGAVTIAAMVPRIYPDLEEALHGAAGNSVYAHLIQMTESGRIICDGEVAYESSWRAAGKC